MPWMRCSLLVTLLTLACAPQRPAPKTSPPVKPNIDPGRVATPATETPPPGKEPEAEQTLQPMVPPEAAYSHGWMALASTGVEQFLQRHPTDDGRGVIIGILDTGIDPGIPGLMKTSTGAPKLLDLRDFSHEGAVALKPVTPSGDTVEIGGRRLGGFGRVAALNASGPYLGGTIRELPLGDPPASDLNGNGSDTDTLPILVTRATDGWVLLADTDGDGSLAGERPVHDYLVARESFGWAAKGRPARLNLAANFSSGAGTPRLDLVFDTYSHGTHVAGIAAGHDMYGVTGFNGVAPGAQLLGLKIANSAQGSITTTGSLLRAIDYSIRFAQQRRLPLVLNLSFGVGNEIEGTARIDAIVDSVLAANPAVVFAISAGNDGPGLSTMGFPGSARGSISVGATLPSSFLPQRPNGGGSQDDQLAYFSSRGGQLAKPDLVAPGVAYSTVPRWNTGHEIEQGTSMASPHAAGLAALLVSQLVQENRPIRAAEIKQALMVTASPLRGSSFVDEGTGLPQVEQASEWLKEPRTVPEITVRALNEEGRASAALHERRPRDSVWVQHYELTRSDTARRAVYTLRSDASWASAPARVSFAGRSATVEVRYRLADLKVPGGYTATVSGWGADTLAGPAFRLVSTILAPEQVASGSREVRSAARVEAGGQLRTFFRADSARPLELRISSGNLGQKGLAFLHEPGGMPYRDEYTRPIGSADREAVYQVDGRDVVSGIYEAVVVAPTVQPLSINLRLIQSPLRMELGRDRSAFARLTNVSPAPVRTEVAMLLGGAERIETVAARGSDVRRIPFIAPAWAKAVVVELTMEPEQWGRFTDFGVTLFDSAGRQVEKQPLNYAFGRLQAKLPENHGAMPLELGLFPGFADPAGDQNWTLRAAIRLYSDSAVALDPVAAGDTLLTIAPGASTRVQFTLPESPWPLGDGFFPLAVAVARADEHSWTREGGLPLPLPAMMR